MSENSTKILNGIRHRNFEKKEFIELCCVVLAEVQTYLKKLLSMITLNYGFEEVQHLDEEEITEDLVRELLDEVEEDKFPEELKDWRNNISVLDNTKICDLTVKDCHDPWEIFLTNYEQKTKISSPEEFSEYIFLGDDFHNIITLTKFGTVHMPLSAGEIILDSLTINGGTNGLLTNHTLSEIATLLHHHYSPLFVYYNVGFLNNLMNGGTKYLKFLKNYNGTKTHKIYLPHYDSMHFTLYVVNLTNENAVEIYYYDSLAGEMDAAIPAKIFEILKATSIKYQFNLPENYVAIKAQCPRQNNNTDCGVYTILNMYHPLSGENPGLLNYTYDDESYRTLIRNSLLEAKVDLDIITKLRSGERDQH